MAQEGKKGEMKPVSFKMPMDTWLIVQAAATARGVDVSSVLNWVIAENLPKLIRLQAQREAALAIAATEGLADAVSQRLERIEMEEGPEAASSRLLDLLGRLQAVEAERNARGKGDGGAAKKVA